MILSTTFDEKKTLFPEKNLNDEISQLTLKNFYLFLSFTRKVVPETKVTKMINYLFVEPKKKDILVTR